MEQEVMYRVYYKEHNENIKFDGFIYTPPHPDIEHAEKVLEEIAKEKKFIEGHIKEEVTTKRIIKAIG